MATVEERIKKIVVDQLGVEVEEIVSTASFVDDLGADSLDQVELIMSLEEEFEGDKPGINITDDDAEKIVTYQDAVDFIRDLGIKDNDDPLPTEPRPKPAAQNNSKSQGVKTP